MYKQRPRLDFGSIFSLEPISCIFRSSLPSSTSYSDHMTGQSSYFLFNGTTNSTSYVMGFSNGMPEGFDVRWCHVRDWRSLQKYLTHERHEVSKSKMTEGSKLSIIQRVPWIKSQQNMMQQESADSKHPGEWDMSYPWRGRRKWGWTERLKREGTFFGWSCLCVLVCLYHKCCHWLTTLTHTRLRLAVGVQL